MSQRKRSHSNKSARRAANRWASQGDKGAGQQAGKGFALWFALGLTACMITGLVLFIIGHVGIANASGGGSNAPVGYGSLNHPKGPCGNSGQAACAPADPGWSAISSTSPGAIAQAIASSHAYVTMQAQFGYVALDTPALVHSFGAQTGNSYYDDDHWVVSVRNASGMRCGIFDFVYDSAHQRLRFSSYGVVTSLDPHASQAFPYIAASAAISRLQSQRGLKVMAGTQPELIFFPIDPNFPVLTSPVHKWAGGGNSAMNPVWLIAGSDRHTYFVGTDLKAYTQQELPIAKGQP